MINPLIAASYLTPVLLRLILSGMARPKQEKCKFGHPIEEVATAQGAIRRVCRQCARDRTRRCRKSVMVEEREAELDRRDEELRARLEREEITFDQFRVERDRLGDGKLRRNRKRFVRVSKVHSELCEKCQDKVFPKWV